MTSIVNRATSKLHQILTAQTGLNGNIALLAQAEDVSISPLNDEQFVVANVSSDLVEKAGATKYTSVYIYCDKVSNTLREKFRSFSGSLLLAADVRVSQDRIEGIDQQSHFYTDAVTHVLDQSRGDWGQGLFYPGGYEVTFGPVKHGGRNFIKSAKVTFSVEASID